MKVVDDAWNKKDWDTLENCYAEDVKIYWPDRQEPYRGRAEYIKAVKTFIKGFPDAHIENNPYKVCFGQDEWICTVTALTGTNNGMMTRPDGAEIPPTNKIYRGDFCTIARWDHNQIVEERIFYDMANMMKQLGLMSSESSGVSGKSESQKIQTVIT